MVQWNPQVNELFLKAQEIGSPEDRRAFLDDACVGDADLRAKVEALLKAGEEAGSFLEGPAIALAETVHQSPPEGPGTVIGPYKLVEQIGEGGFGVVFLAEQTAPVRRKVALKVLKPGMDTRQVIARFEAERQALAIMDHPNIARVFDGGETGGVRDQVRVASQAASEEERKDSSVFTRPSPLNSRPYFVMELVKGIPITNYCDQCSLTTKERLELFLSVCHAVQHAHQKGIIHRDLKPSNVLVAIQDGKPMVKVIDFGVAKAVAGVFDPGSSAHTGFHQLIGTPLYMSPEQAEMSPLDVDTRADIYSLGVLLYELLTGTTPFEKERLSKVSYDELRRIIREEEPPRPSVRLSPFEQNLSAVAAQRRTEPRHLLRILRGELDWIVMKALEKDRNRRYETASAFAADIQRYLNDEPVQACPPSVGYRLRKFARRNRGKLAIAALIIFFLALLGAGSAWVALDRAARWAKAVNDLELALERADLYLKEGKRADARAALVQAEQLAAGMTADPAHNERFTDLKQRLDDEERDQRFVAGYEDIRLRVLTNVDVAKSRFTTNAAYREIRELLDEFGIPIGKMDVAQAITRIRNRPDRVRQELLVALQDYGNNAPDQDAQIRKWLSAVFEAAAKDPWRDKVQKAILAKDWKEVERHARDVDVSKHAPSNLLLIASALPEELKSQRLQTYRRIQLAYPGDFWSNISLAWELIENGRHGEAIRYLTAALALRPDNPGILLNRGNCLAEVGEVDEAIADYRRCLALAPRYVTALSNLAGHLRQQGKLEDALAACNQAIEIDPTFAAAWANRGLVHFKLDQLEMALADHTKAIELDPNLTASWSNRGEVYRLLGQFHKAMDDCTKAIELDDKHAIAWANRADCYLQLGQFEKALAESSRAVELDKKSVYALYLRGGAYSSLGDHARAIADCTAAVKLGPSNCWAHYNLGTVLATNGRLKEAIPAFRKAIQLDDNYAEAHCNLGGALQHLGEFREALKEMRRGHDIGSKKPGWRYPSEKWVKNLERLVELDERLSDLLASKKAVASPMEAIELAKLCTIKQFHRGAARFYQEALAAQPKLFPGQVEVHRYNAACAAALAGCGQGKDADKSDDKERSRLRQQALGGLRVNLQVLARILEKEPSKGKALAAMLQRWLDDPDFAGVRGQEALAQLPEAEGRPWKKLWQDVADLQTRALAKALPKRNQT